MNQLQQRFIRISPILIALGGTALILSFLFGVFQGTPAAPLRAQSLRMPAESTDMLAIYALAFDNEPGSPNNLSDYYTPTVQSIVSATAAAPDRVAVILVDLDDYGDTHVIIAQNGVKVTVEGLPAANSLSETVTLNLTMNEYNMADGWYLGNFIRWARQLYPAHNTIFSLVGHGAPLTPQLQPLNQGSPSQEPNATPTPPGTPTPQDGVNPLPPRWGAHADFTDYHAASLISVRSLAQALAIGSQDGANPLTVVDLLHCFSATIEELYEVHPYARTLIAAPNYTYAQPTMLGETLATLDNAQTPSVLAKSIVASYDALLPSTEHPRLFVAVDADKVAPIKAAWDQTASEMLKEFASDENSARSHLLAAYQSSAKYDTTICQPQDWQLVPPDALSDMADFANQLRNQFGAQSPVGTWALSATQSISNAIIARHSHDGTPWFATVSPAPQWQFPGAGIALFTDFAPEISPESVAGRPNFSWQAAWYTYTVSQGNRYPYAFIQPANGSASWADLFSRFWTEPITSTTGCIQGFVSGRGAGELSVTALATLANSSEESLAFSAIIHSAAAATNPLLRFRVYQRGESIFEDVVGSGYLGAGITQTVASSAVWIPSSSDVYTLEALIDVDNRFDEADEDDNVITITVPISVENWVYLPLVRK